jgi:hypothetical protein
MKGTVQAGLLGLAALLLGLAAYCFVRKRRRLAEFDQKTGEVIESTEPTGGRAELKTVVIRYETAHGQTATIEKSVPRGRTGLLPGHRDAQLATFLAQWLPTTFFAAGAFMGLVIGPVFFNLVMPLWSR